MTTEAIGAVSGAQTTCTTTNEGGKPKKQGKTTLAQNLVFGPVGAAAMGENNPTSSIKKFIFGPAGAAAMGENNPTYTLEKFVYGPVGAGFFSSNPNDGSFMSDIIKLASGNMSKDDFAKKYPHLSSAVKTTVSNVAKLYDEDHPVESTVTFGIVPSICSWICDLF